MSSLRLCDVMQPEDYMIIEIHNWCKWLDSYRGK